MANVTTRFIQVTNVSCKGYLFTPPKARALLQYLRRDGPTYGTDPAFKRQTNDQLLQGLVLMPKSSDLRRNFHLMRAFELFALQRGHRERGLCNSLEK